MNTMNTAVQHLITDVDQRSCTMPRLVLILFMMLLIVPTSTAAQSGNMTALANTTSDENGNYTFTNLPVGDYAISVAYYTPAMGGKWFTGSMYTSVDDGDDKSGIDVWLTFGDEADAHDVLNAKIDPSGLTGTSAISGRTLAHKYDGSVVAMANATVIISSYLKGDLNNDGRLTSIDALIALRMSAGTREPDLRGDMNLDGMVTSLDALMILQEASIPAVSIEDPTTVMILAPSTQTGANGAFGFVNLSAGTYTLTAYIESERGNALGTTVVTLGEGEHNGSVMVNASVDQATDEALNAAKNATVSYNASAPVGTGSISGNARILMGPNYVGVSGITVAITGYDGEGSLEEYAYIESSPDIKTCDYGYFRFRNLPAGDYTLTAYAAGMNPMGVMSYAVGNATLLISKGDWIDDLVVRLEPSDESGVDAARSLNATYLNNGIGGDGVLTGTALIHMGEPYIGIANTTVAITAYAGNGSLEDVKGVMLECIDAPVVTTDENGTYRFTGLPAGKYTFIAHRYIPSMAPAMPGINKTVSFTLELDEGETCSAGDNLLNTTDDSEFVASLPEHDVLYELNGSTGSGVVDGTILSAGMSGDAEPSEGVAVYLYSYEGEGTLADINREPVSNEFDAPWVTTGVDGSFYFNHLPAGNYTITALCGDEIGALSIDIGADEHVSDLEIWLDESTDSETADVIRNTTYINSGGAYGASSISGRVLNLSEGSFASVIITRYIGDGNLGSVNREPKIAFFLLSDGDIFLTSKAAENIGLNVSVYSNYRVPPDLNLTTYNAIFTDRLVTEPIQNVIEPILNEAKEQNVSVICSYADLGNVNLTEHPHIKEYWSSRNTRNMERLLVYLGVAFCGLDGVIEEPCTIPEEGIYHPDADRIFEDLSEYILWYGDDTGATGRHHVYNPDNLTVGIVFWKERYGTGETGVVDAIIRAVEDRGANVIAAYPPYLLFEENMTKFFAADGEPAVDVMIDLGLGMGPLTVMVKQREYLEEMDVPVMKCIELYSGVEDWENDTTGKGPYFNMQIPVMEIAGEIEFIVVGGRVYNATYDASLLQPIDYQVDWAVDRALSWGSLRRIENSEKNVAIIYYAHTGNASALAAANLDVAPSIVNILHAMNDSERGYTLGEDIPTDKELLDLVFLQGRNLGIWVPDQIRYVAENCDVALVPKDEYLTWFNRLPEKKRNEVTERWGEPPGKIMVYENESGSYIVIPKITLGNILIAPQPSRASSQNMTALYHDKSVPPTHQYIAFYYWLNHVYEADAIVSVGRHGSQEWLPGKGVGLSVEDCWPAILIQDMPVVYHYEVEGIGEGVMAKRRGSAVMIDHLTPVIVAAGLYGNLSNLEQTIPLYEQEENGTLKEKYREQIIDMCRDLNLGGDLDVDLDEIAASDDDDFEEFLDEMHDYLLEIKREYMPYGLHIMGKQLSDDGLVDMTKSLLGYKFREYIETTNITENQTRLLISEVILNGKTSEEAQELVLGRSENATDPTPETETVIAKTISDENGNYTFSDIPPGNYTIDVACYTTAMGGCWFIGCTNTSVSDGESLTDIDVWLTFGDEAAANDILNATIDPGGLTGTSSISGRALGAGPYGIGVVPKANATVVISRQDSDEEVPEETPLTDFLNLAILYAENLRECIIEIPRTLDALEGKYIPPGPSNDPIRNPDVLPTGRNFYGFDPDIVPTEPAWEVGCELIDQLLSQYCNETDECYPEKIGFVMFSFNTMKDLGVLESELFYLLGVEPVWGQNGNVIDVKIIPTDELKRPRIDVVVTMSGIYRENWPHQIELINKAVRLAAEEDDSPHHRNFVNESTQRTYQWLIKNNYTESEAHELSLIRIFGPPDGVWGVGGFIAAIEGTGTWENESTLADLYIRNMANVYGDTIWGEQYVDLFRQNLNGTEVALFGWSSHSHSVLGIDHTFEFFGGLSMAIRSITGEAPDMYINNLKDPDGAKLETLQHVLMRDLRSIYFNELWIRGMMEHDYAGASKIATIMANLWGWDVTCPGVITEEMWDMMYSIYVQDEYKLGLADWFDENNPYAYQSATARMLEAIRKGYWNPSDEVLKTLVSEYIESVAENGASCCHHTCGNPTLDSYISGVLSMPGVVTDETAAKYREVMSQVTGMQSTSAQSDDSGSGSRSGTYPPDWQQETEYNQASSASNETTTESEGGVGTDVSQPVNPVSSSENYVEGQKMEVETQTFKTAPSSSGAPMMAIIAVIAILALIGIGLRFKRK